MANIAFYTRGDTRSAHGDTIWFPSEGYRRIPTMTELYKLRAERLVGAGHAQGATSRANATAILNGLTAHSVRKIYFVGHGAGGGFFFNGHPVGADDFSAPWEQTLHADPLDTDFAAALLRALHSTQHVDVIFLSCYTASFDSVYPDLLAALSAVLHTGRGNLHHSISGFENYYQVNYRVNQQGQITSFRDDVVSSDSAHVTLAHATSANGIPPFERTVP